MLCQEIFTSNQHEDFYIVKAETLGLIALLSGISAGMNERTCPSEYQGGILNRESRSETHFRQASLNGRISAFGWESGAKRV